MNQPSGKRQPDLPSKEQDVNGIVRRECTVLFVEDQRAHIDSILDAIDRHDESWSYEIAWDAWSAYDRLTRSPVQVIVLDVMLSAIARVPSGSEGIYLAAMIQGRRGVPSDWSGNILDDNRDAPLVVLTARGAQNVVRELKAFKPEYNFVVELGEKESLDSFKPQLGRGVFVVEKASYAAEGAIFYRQILCPLVERRKGRT